MAVSDEDRALSFTSVYELAHLMQSKKLSPVDLVTSVFRRIETLNHKPHAFLTICEEEAIQIAHHAEDALAGGELWGPLHGIPIGIKDLYNTGGIPTTYGSLVFPGTSKDLPAAPAGAQP